MLIDVDAANAIAEFLTRRRAGVTPEQAGLPTWGRSASKDFAARRSPHGRTCSTSLGRRPARWDRTGHAPPSA
jgi:hypothetical protein